MANKIMLEMEMPVKKLHTAPPQKTNNRKQYVAEILEYMGWSKPQATPAPEFSESTATEPGEPKVQRIKVKKK